VPERRRVVTPDHVARLESKVDALVEALSERSRDPDQTARFSILPPAPGEPRLRPEEKRALGWGWFKRSQSLLAPIAASVVALTTIGSAVLGTVALLDSRIEGVLIRRGFLCEVDERGKALVEGCQTVPEMLRKLLERVPPAEAAP
jgi:hypothetical protein